MANPAFLRLLKDDSAEMFLPEDGTLLSSRLPSGMEQISEASRGKRLIVLIPGSDVHCASRLLPVRNRQKILQAIPYTLEEDLIGDVQSFHFAIPSRLPTDHTPVCAINRERLEAILDLLDEHRMHPQVVMPFCLLLPGADRQWNILIEDDESLIQRAPFDTLAVDTVNLDTCLELALQEADTAAPDSLNIIDTRLAADHSFLDRLDTDQISLSHQELDSGLLPWLASLYHDDAGINLLQGDFTPRKIATQSYKKWYPALTLLAVIFVLQTASAVTDYVRLGHESEQLDSRINELFRQSLPDVKRMVDPKNQMQQRLNTLKSSSRGLGSGFLPVLEKFSRSMQSDNSIALRGLNFRNGRLDIELTITDVQALEKFKQAMIQSGLQVDIRSATVQGNAVFARLRVQGAA